MYSSLNREIKLGRAGSYILIFGLLIAVTATTFLVTKHLTYQTAYSRGHHAGFEEESANVPGSLEEKLQSSQKQDYDQLIGKYNQLSDQYNQLRSVVIKYVDTANYQPANHITCNSVNYGINNQFVSTTCN